MAKKNKECIADEFIFWLASKDKDMLDNFYATNTVGKNYFYAKPLVINNAGKISVTCGLFMIFAEGKISSLQKKEIKRWNANHYKAVIVSTLVDAIEVFTQYVTIGDLPVGTLDITKIQEELNNDGKETV